MGLYFLIIPDINTMTVEGLRLSCRWGCPACRPGCWPARPVGLAGPARLAPASKWSMKILHYSPEEREERGTVDVILGDEQVFLKLYGLT